jgi:hypothetical protein
MNAAQMDEAIRRWMQAQPGLENASYHAQIKIKPGLVEMAQLTALGLAGWVVLDWQAHGLGLSLKHAVKATDRPIAVAQVIDELAAPALSAHIQIILAPAGDWEDARAPDSLVPDLKQVLDHDHARALSVSAQRAGNGAGWQITSACQPPDDAPIELT